MSLLRLGLPLFIAQLLVSCISVISPQSANTLDPGQVSAYAALTTPAVYQQSSKKSKDDSDSDSSDKGDSLEALWIDVGTRYGLVEGLDFGIEKTNLITHFDLKKRLLGSGDGFTMAVGAGIGSNNLAGFTNSKKANYFIRTSDIPIYLSQRIGQSTTIYSTLKYHYTHIQSGYASTSISSSDTSSSSSKTSDEISSSSARNIALSLGGIFGEPVGFFLEVAMIKGMDKVGNDAARPQLALGVTLLNSKPHPSEKAVSIPAAAPPKPRKKREP